MLNTKTLIAALAVMVASAPAMAGTSAPVTTDEARNAPYGYETQAPVSQQQYSDAVTLDPSEIEPAAGQDTDNTPFDPINAEEARPTPITTDDARNAPY